jgi:AraC-like DNA-binding protein
MASLRFGHGGFMQLERLLDNLALEMEAFAVCHVAPGWRLRLPALDRVTFHFVVQGEGEARDSGSDPRALAPGSILLVPPHQVHSLQCGPPPHAERGAESRAGRRAAPQEYRAGPEAEPGMVVVCGRARVLYGGGLGVFDHLREPLVVDFADEPKMAALFEAMLAEVGTPRPGSPAMVSALMDEFLVHLFRRLNPEDGSPAWLDALDAPVLEPALLALSENPGEPHSVATLAALCHMSRSTFARRFKESVGRAPMEYLRGIRLRRAARFLRQVPPPSVGAVSRRVGFESRSQFSRAFKAHFGITPSRFAAETARQTAAPTARAGGHRRPARAAARAVT